MNTLSTIDKIGLTFAAAAAILTIGGAINIFAAL